MTVVEELAKAGFSGIMLRTVQLPEVRGMSQANVDTAPVSIANILSQYITEAATAAQQFHAKVSVSMMLRLIGRSEKFHWEARRQR